MRFRNAFHLLLENFRNVYKILLYKLVVAIICVALYSALILPQINAIFSSQEWTNLLADAREFLSAFLPGATVDYTAIRDQIMNQSLPAFGSLVVGMMGGIIWRFVGCAVVYLLQCFADTMCYFTTGAILNNKMTTYAETSFGEAYIKNLGKSAKYSLVYVPIAFLFDVATAALCLLALSLLSTFAAFFICVTIIAVMQSWKLTCTAAWMPSMTEDNLTIGQAFKALTKEERAQRSKLFTTYLAVVYLIMIINVIAFFCTMGSALLLTIPASFMILICVQYVNYFTLKGKKYFLTYQAIESNEHRGDTEHFFSYVAEETTETTEESAEVETTEEAVQENTEVETTEEAMQENTGAETAEAPQSQEN